MFTVKNNTKTVVNIIRRDRNVAFEIPANGTVTLDDNIRDLVEMYAADFDLTLEDKKDAKSGNTLDTSLDSDANKKREKAQLDLQEKKAEEDRKREEADEKARKAGKPTQEEKEMAKHDKEVPDVRRNEDKVLDNSVVDSTQKMEAVAAANTPGVKAGDVNPTPVVDSHEKEGAPKPEETNPNSKDTVTKIKEDTDTKNVTQKK